jgi:hypothetical protein
MVALTLLASGITLSPLRVKAQDDKQAEFERTWYAACYQEKNEDKCLQLSKELLDKYPKSTYAKNATSNIKNKSLNDAWQKFQAALDAFYKQPPQDAAKLEALFSAGDAYLQVEPDQQSPSHLFAVGQMALAGQQASLGKKYENLDKVKDYTERAMKEFEGAQPSEKTKKDFDSYVVPLKDLVIANGNQFLGFRLTETKGDPEQALTYLTKATQVKSKDVGWKDPLNYWLRSTVYSAQYTELRKPYDAMTDEQKVSDAGKEVLKKVNELLDTKLIPEYARVLATATKPEAKTFYDAAKPQFDAFWKYRTDAPDKADAYVKNYAADPTIPAVPIPAKADTAQNMAAPTAPAAGGAAPNLSSSGSAMEAGANGKGSATGAGATKKPAAATRTTKKRRG